MRLLAEVIGGDSLSSCVEVVLAYGSAVLSFCVFSPFVEPAGSTNGLNTHQLARISSLHKANVIRTTAEKCETRDLIAYISKELEVHIEITAKAIAHRWFERQVQAAEDELVILVEDVECDIKLCAEVAAREGSQFVRCRHHTADCSECRYLPFNNWIYV